MPRDNVPVKRFELALDVGPIDPDTVTRLKDAGFEVYRGAKSWRVTAVADAIGDHSIRAQAHVMVRDIIADFGLEQLSEPPLYSVRDPEAEIDAGVASLIIEDARRAYDPDPLQRVKRKWWQKQLGRDPREDRW